MENTSTRLEEAQQKLRDERAWGRRLVESADAIVAALASHYMGDELRAAVRKYRKVRDHG